MEELELIVASVKQEMDAAIKHLDYAFQKIRAGRASTAMVQDVMVEYYGAPTPLNQVANVSVPDAMTIAIQPWDRTAINAIEKGIIVSNLGFAPSNNGEMIILNVPPLTEERLQIFPASVNRAPSTILEIGKRYSILVVSFTLSSI